MITVTHGTYALPTVKGPVRASFKAPASAPAGGREEQEGALAFSLEVELPLGVEATVSLPRRHGEGAALLSMDGRAVACLVERAHLTVERVGPGKHSFVLLRMPRASK